MTSVQEILSRLRVEQLDRLLFRGSPNQWPSRHVFGGHVIAQAMEAASETVDAAFALHSVHCYFLRAGDAERDIIYDVDPIRDGRNFTTRRVVAIQNGNAIFSVAFNYHRAEPGPDYQTEMGDVPGPDGLEDDESTYHRFMKSVRQDPAILPTFPFEMRNIDPMDPANPTPKDPVGGYWMRLKEPLAGDNDDPGLHVRLLAYQSDYALISAAMRPHGLTHRDGKVKTVASLDHSLWLHRTDFRVDEWIFYKTEGYWTGSGRGLSRGALYNADGRLLASTAQEGLIRVHDANDGSDTSG